MGFNNRSKIKSTALILTIILSVSIMLSVIASAGNLIFNSNRIRSIYTGRDYDIPQNAAGKGSVLSGIDVSSWNGYIDFNRVKRAGTEFVFIRVGCRGYGTSGNIKEDLNFKSNIVNAKNAGLKVGVYFFSQALTPEEASCEADFIIDRIKPYRNMIDLPVVMDYEFNGVDDGGRLWAANLSKQQMTENALAFINRVKKERYTPCLYASVNFLENNLCYEKIEPVAKIWAAHYLGQNQQGTYYKGRVDYWQYSSFGYVDGVNGRVDANFGFTADSENENPNGYKIDDLNLKKTNSTPLYRMYNPNSGEHFYTKSVSEKDFLISVGWVYEGIGWYAPDKSKTPVYRLYNPNAGDHHYTTDIKERDNLIWHGWRYENIAFYANDSRGTPVYRQYNPNAKSGAHNFTKDKYENDNLVKEGWRAEGISWYVV